jgi:Fe-S oxidoreductase
LPDTGIVLNCCGAPTHLLGDHEGFNAILGTTVRQIQDMGAEEIIFACPDCFHTFKDFAPGMKFSTVYQAMAELGTPEPVIKGDKTAFSIHDSCITRHETDLQESVRHLIRSMGYGIEELDYSREMIKCCGAGGMAANANPKFLTQVIKKRADESPYDYITYCAGCGLTFAYVKKPVLHVLDLLFSSDLEKGKLKPPPNPLVKWWNRWKLKKTLQNMGS